MRADRSMRCSIEVSALSGAPRARRSCHACTEKYQARHAKLHGSTLLGPAPNSLAGDSVGAAPQAAGFNGIALQEAGSAGDDMRMDGCSQLPMALTATQGPCVAWLLGGDEGEAAWGTAAAAAATVPRKRARAQPTRPWQAVAGDLLHLCTSGAFGAREQQGPGGGAAQVTVPYSEHAAASLGHMGGLVGIPGGWESLSLDEAAARSATSYGRAAMGSSGRSGATPNARGLRSVSATMAASRAASGYDGARNAQPTYALLPSTVEAVDSAGGHSSAWASQPVSRWQGALDAPDPIEGFDSASAAQPAGAWLGWGAGASAARPARGISVAAAVEPTRARTGLFGGADGMPMIGHAASLPVAAAPPDIDLSALEPGDCEQTSLSAKL